MSEVKKKRPPGRPARPMPEPVPATPDELVRVLVTTPPKKEWQPRIRCGADALGQRVGTELAEVIA